MKAFAIAIVATVLSASAFSLAEEASPLRVGCQAYTFNQYTVYEAVQKTADAGGTVIEFYPGQVLSADDKQEMGPGLSDEQIAALRKHLKECHVTATSYYTPIPRDIDEARHLFEFAKRLGLESLTTESDDAIDTIDKLVKEFDIRVGFHGHPKDAGDPNYRLWDPQFVLGLTRDRDPRIGACADTGHWASSGVVPLDSIKLLEGRIINLHLKDRLVLGRPSTDQILGKGITNIPGIIEELHRQGFRGCVFIEYETNWTGSVPDVRQCIENVRSAEARSAKPPTLPAAATTQPVMLRQLAPGLKSVVIDSDDHESFLGLQLDSAGRLFVGGREALFAYEPAAGGLYQPRQLLFRFPKDAWVYDIAIRGDDLYVSTHTAIYLLPGAVKKRDGIVAKRLVWGLPMMEGFDTHQGIHGLAIGPEGDIYFSNGDEIIGYGDFKRPDHWSHWSYFHGSKSTEVTGCGGLFRISPDGEDFTVIAAGTRNSCGIAFDRAWNLFTSDNDHESMPDQYVPGRLLHVTPGAYFSWPRGWMPEKTPWRADLLDSMDPDVGRYVPTGMAYYDDAVLPDSCRHCLYVAEWGKGKLLRYPLQNRGASFKVEESDFLTAPPAIRPVGVAVGRGGRIFVTLCHMEGNEASPTYASELLMLTRDNDSDAAPFDSYEETTAPVEKLYAELASSSWHRRYRAHVELLRRGSDACKQAADYLDKASVGSALHSHLLWLTAAAGAMEKIEPLVSSPNPETRYQAIRAIARFSPAPRRSIFEKGLDDSNPQVVQVALATLRDRFDAAPISKVIALARGSDRLLRQISVQLLASKLDMDQIQKLCESADAADRLVGILCAGQRLTVPPLAGPLPGDWAMSPMNNSVTFVGEKVDFISGSFTMADIWTQRSKSPDVEKLFALVERRLNDAAPDNARQAAFFLRLLKDSRTDAECAKILGLPSDLAVKGTPLKGAVSTGITELPEAFKKVDWSKEVTRGDPKVGAKLFNERGCTTCHAYKPGDAGGGGPSLAGAGTRFTIPYLVESVITPNKVVSPIYKWTMVTKKSGDSIAGLITTETGAEIELLLPTGIRETIKKADIAKRELQDRSPMPEGIITTPEELRDLLSYLITLKDEK